MATLKLVVWNMEWLNDLFVAENKPAAFRPDTDKTGHSDATVKQRCDDLIAILNLLDADIVVIVEGPSRAAELQLLFDHPALNGTWQTHLQNSGQQQEIGLAVRVDRQRFQNPPFRAFDTDDPVKFPAFDTFQADLDEDSVEEHYSFERKPVYAEIYPIDGQPFRVLGLHLKSKGIFGAYEWSKWWQLAEGNRRKILAQATQIRLNFLDPYLKSADTQNIPLIVCGDINDGPGLDASEKRLFGSGIERLMGTIWDPTFCLHNALFEDLLTAQKQAALDFEEIVTTSFADPIFNNTYHRVWIDHILYSTALGRKWVSESKIHERFGNDPIWKKFPHSSDHFPISVTVTT